MVSPPPDHVWDAGLQPERTRLAWQRTSLSLLGAALVVARLVAVRDVLLGGLVAFVALAVSAAVAIHTTRRYRRSNRALFAGNYLPGGRVNAAMTGLLVLSGIGAAIYALG